MPDKAAYLVEHYQKTFEMTSALWRDRNQMLLFLLTAIAAATLVTFPALGARDLLIRYLLNSNDSDKIKEFQASFPFAVLQAIGLFVVFFLMVNLFQRSTAVLRNYSYLGELEKEIRSLLEYEANAVPFSRESTFYWGKSDWFSSSVKITYIVLLSVLLLGFVVGAFVNDMTAENWWLVGVDLVFGSATLLYFFGYARAVLVSGKPNLPVEPPSAVTATK